MFKRFLKKNANDNDLLDKEQLATVAEAKKISAIIHEWQHDTLTEKISIGQNCNSAWYLKETKNKNGSYPFDWIFSSAEIVLHAIDDGFVSFLDKEEIYSINNKRAGHLKYHSSMFNHKNPLESKDDYDYYVRCVKRFKTIVQSDIPIIFVCTVVNEPAKRLGWSNGFDRQITKPLDQTITSFTAMMSKIKQIHPRSKFLFINQFTESILKIEHTFYANDVLWIDFVSKGSNTGVKYLDSFDDTLIKIIYNGLSEKK